jgi:tetratricopeptide (TPR) repeat protein
MLKNLYALSMIALCLSTPGNAQIPPSVEPRIGIEDLNQKLKENPADEKTQLSRALSLEVLGQALGDYEAVAQKDPQNFEALMGIARVKVSLGKYEEAIRDYTKLAETKPKLLADVLVDRGLTYGNSKVRAYDKAKEDFLQALKMDPNHVSANNGLAWLEATCPNKEFRDGFDASNKAILAYNTLNSKSPRDQRTLAFLKGTVAAAYAEYGATYHNSQFSNWAVGWQNWANSDFSAMGDVRNLEIGNERVKLYEKTMPFRDLAK